MDNRIISDVWKEPDFSYVAFMAFRLHSGKLNRETLETNANLRDRLHSKSSGIVQSAPLTSSAPPEPTADAYNSFEYCLDCWLKWFSLRAGRDIFVSFDGRPAEVKSEVNLVPTVNTLLKG